MLTRQQRDLLEYIIAFQTSEGGVSPSFDDMKNHLGLKSKSGVHRLVRGLEEREFLCCIRGRARAITVLRGPMGGTQSLAGRA